MWPEWDTKPDPNSWAFGLQMAVAIAVHPLSTILLRQHLRKCKGSAKVGTKSDNSHNVATRGPAEKKH